MSPEKVQGFTCFMMFYVVLGGFFWFHLSTFVFWNSESEHQKGKTTRKDPVIRKCACDTWIFGKTQSRFWISIACLQIGTGMICGLSGDAWS